MSTLKVSTISPLGTDATKTITLGESGGTLGIASGAKTSGFGKIGQIVSTSKTDTFSTTSTSYTDVDNLSISITPSTTSSKILIQFYGQGSTSNTDTGQIRLDRDGTDIFLGDSDGSKQQSTVALSQGDGSKMRNVSFNYIDSPSTTSAVTYKIQLRANSGTSYLGRSRTDGDSTGYPRTPLQFIAMEILD